MLAALSLLLTQPSFTPPILWASGFAAPPRIPLVGDVNADGYADLICVYPPGDAIIDVSLNIPGGKAGVPFQALPKWGKDCQTAITGDFDDQPGTDVIGLFGGDTMRLAHGFSKNRFTDKAAFAKLPEKLEKPSMRLHGDSVVVWSGPKAFAVDIKSGKVAKAQAPKTAKETWPELPPTGRPAAPTLRFSADFDKDGDLDIVEYRYGSERHTAHDVLLYRSLEATNPDEDGDGLSNDEEIQIATDPLNPDTDGDGLLDGWEVGTYRELDFKSLGCNPRRIDLICLISRYSNVDEGHVKKELDRVKATYAALDVTNPDGSKGWSFHPIYLAPVEEKDHPASWQANRGKFRRADWKGIVHWMQITPGGGGQADQMGDGGGCGANSLWAVFLHEFGHQIGMDHNGFWGPGLCPIYTSLMSYAYSYSLEDDGNRIAYSNGRFKDFVLDERNLDENLPFPYEQVKFLEKGPYRFRLKANGDTTQIDWNWNGIFGEKGIRADINYSYSTNAGRRDDIGKIMTSPWLFTHGGKAWSVYGTHDHKADPKTDPTISLEKTGDLWIRKLQTPFKWEERRKLDFGKLVGDPVAISKDGWIYVAAPVVESPWKGAGVGLWRVREKGKELQIEGPKMVSSDPSLTPTIGSNGPRLYVFLWDPASGAVTYHTLDKGLEISPERRLLRRSTIPVGMAVDTIKGEILLGAAEDQDDKRPTRWQIRRYVELSGRLIEKNVEWIEGETGGARGYGRATVLFDASKEAGPDGRIYFFGRGMTSKENPWACTYVAHQIADKSVRGGWLVKRFYDEWTQSRSAPAAAWFNGDIIWAYRWVDASQNERDNLLHVGYRALGIDEEPMGDHDDISFFRDIGIRRSILYLAK